jgi:ribosomal protein L18
MVARISNKYVTCQIVYSTMTGDLVLESAHSSELPKYGVKVGLANYAACYCTGLLLARRVLTKLKVRAQFPSSCLRVSCGCTYVVRGGLPVCGVCALPSRRKNGG